MKVFLGLVVTTVALLGGCATVIEGGDQVVNVSTTGCEEYGSMQCTLQNDDGSSVLTAPGSVSVGKDKDALKISCRSKDGLAFGDSTVESKYEAWNAGNLLLGGVIGVGVDAATGAMWKYPSAVVVPMKCDSALEQREVRENSSDTPKAVSATTEVELDAVSSAIAAETL